MADPNSVNPYEQIWKTRDLRALETPLELENKLSSFERGVGRFKEQMKGTGYGLAALASQGVQNVIGENPVTQGITDWGLEGYNETTAKSQPGAMYAPKVAKVEDIKTPSDALEWGAGLLGEQLPLAGSLLLTGGIGGAIARLGANAAVKDIAGAAVGTAVKKGVEQGALKAVEGELITDTMRKAASKALLDTTLKGAAITGFAGTAGLEGGLSFGGSIQEGAKPEDAVKSAIAVGGLNGALELLAPFVVAKKMGLGEYAKKSIADIISNDADLSKKAIALATAKELGTRGIKGFAEGATVEGITEGLQELTSIAGERWAKNSPLFADLTDEDWSRIKNSTAGGAFIGGGLSGAGATVSGPQTEQTKVQTKITVPAQSKLDVLKANQAKLVEQINETIKAGDTKKAEELQAIKDIYDLAINKTQEVIPAQEKPALEGELVQEPAKETPVSEVAPVVEANAPTLETVKPTEEEMANGQVQAQTETPLTEPPVQEPSNIIASSLAPSLATTWEGATPETRTQWLKDSGHSEEFSTRKATEWDTWNKIPPAIAQQRLPKVMPQEVKVPEVMAPEVMAELKTDAAVRSNVTPLYSRPLQKSVSVADVSKMAREPINNVISNITFGNQTLVNKEENVTKRTTARGKEYNFNLYEYDLQDGRKRLVLSAGDPENYVDAGAVIRFENNKPVIEMINADDNFENLGYNLTRQIIKRFGTPVKDESGSFSEIGAKHNAKLPQAESTPVAQEATMEEFEAVRKQFQEKQSDTPVKQWFGKGTPGVTATPEGEPITLYHGTNNPDFYEWDSTHASEASGHPTSGLGFFMTADKGSAARYGSNLLELHAKINNPYTLTDADLTSIETPADATALREKLIKRGYDGAVVTAPGAKPYVIAFQKNQIKLTSNKNPTTGPDMRFSKPVQKPAPTFYSALERTIQETKQEKAPSVQWESSLDNMVKKGLIKQEELDWSGTKEWLQEQKEPVTKEALLKHVRDNTLEVQETELGGYTAKLVDTEDGRLWEIFDRDGNSIDAFEEEEANSEREAIEISGETKGGRNTKWTLPGGENQRELVLTAPSIEPFNTDDTTHYGDVGGGKAVAWIRFNDRTDEDGKKTLFVEEIQSKRHQEGKEKGYIKKDLIPLNELRIEKTLKDKGWHFYDKDNHWVHFVSEYDAATEEEALKVAEQDFKKDTRIIDRSLRFNINDNRVPNAPFKQTIAGSGQTLSGWAGLAFKRMLRYAVENGYDKVAWTTGEQQAKRYNLAQSVSKVAYTSDGYFQAYDRNGRVVMSSRMDEGEVSNYIGKELTNELFAAPVKNGERTVELAEDKVVGGEGMKGFYDRLLPNEINKYVKKWNTKVDKTQMKFGDESASVHTVEITPAMRDSVMQGQPLFSQQAGKQKTVTQQPDTTTVPLQDFHANINSVMGEGWLQQAIDLGLVEVIEGPGPNGESGSWVGGKIRLYTGSMPKGSSPAGVLLHEGKHATFADVLGDSLQEYVKDLHTLAKNGNKVAQDAITHSVLAAADTLGIKHNLLNGGNRADFENLRAIIEARRPGLLAEEELAYFVQYGTEAQGGAGFLRRLVNAIKVWFAQTRLGQRMKELGLGFELTDGMAVEWAKMGLNRSLAEAKQAAKVKVQVEKQAAGMSASARLGKALEVLAAVDPLYSFAGKDALTANLSLQQEAETRIKNGEDKEAVRGETGWFLNEADGKWRFEIDDSKASFKTLFKDIPKSILFGKEILLPLDEVLNHPELFKAYPQIKKISVIKRAGLDARTQGWFNDDTLTIGLSPNATDPLSTMLHEIQHIIQMYEGFVRGGNENSVWDNLTEEDKLKAARDALEKNNKNLREAQDKLDIITVFGENPDVIRNYAEAKRLDDINYKLYKGVENLSYDDPKRTRAREIWLSGSARLKEITAILLDKIGRSDLKRTHELPLSSFVLIDNIVRGVVKDFTAYKETLSQEVVDLYQKATKIKSGDEETIRKVADMYTFYRRLAGETEARLTQARQKMTEEERKLKSPESMQEYPYNEQIVVMPGTKSSGEVFYSMGVKEFQEQLWNDPTDIRPEIVNKPGLLQKFRADFVDFFGEMEKKSKNVYDTYILQRAKKGARIEKSRQTYLLPLRELIANSPWDAKEVGDMLAARHIKIDNINTDLAERASQGYTKKLLKALPSTQQKKLKQARVNVKAGKMPDGSVYKDANGNVVDMSARTKRKLMFDLMNQYAPFEIANTAGVQELNQEWEIFKDAAGGFSNGGIARGIVRTVDNVLAPASKAPAKFDEIANLFDAMNRHTLDILEEGGLITAREHARLLTSKSAYAPLRRESYNIDRETELLFQKASAGGSKQIGTRAGTANLSEPTLVLQNALAKLEATAAAAERNLANQELYNTIMTDREGWKPWFTIANKDQYVTHDEDGFLQEKRATASNRGDIVLIKDGKKIVIQPNMHNERATGFVRAVNNMDVQTLNGPMKVMSWVNSLIRWTNISASPIFLMTNLIRDPLTAAYNLQATEAAEYSKDIFLNWKRAFKALKKVYIDNNRDLTDADVKMLEKFEKAGGRTSFVLSLKEMDDNSFSNFEGQVARRQGSMKYLMKAKDTWLDGIENYNILFENIMRFSTFMTLQEKSQGKISEQRAARIAQDITTNFSRRGYKSQMLGVWWLFFNASVQGNYQVLRNLMSSKRVQVAVGGTIATAVMLDVLGRALTDDWDEIPEWDKERNIILPIKVGGDFVKIPAPWVYNVFWRMGGMIGETLAGKRKPQDTILDMAALTFTTLDPLGKPGSLAQAISPTSADPFVQILENKNFAGNPIGPEGYPGASTKANSELLWSTTPKGYQSFARFVNEVTGGSAVESGKIDLRPGDYQLLADFLTGSFGKFLTDTTFGFANKLDKGIEGPKDIPIIKEFFSDPSNPMMVQKYHTNIATIYGAHRLEQMYVKGPERDLIKLQEVREKRGNELRMYAQAQDVEKQLKSLRVKLRAAQNREDTRREKELKERMNKVQEQFNKKFEQNVK